jgi:tetratricopeptide (TPR) repeat protein
MRTLRILAVVVVVFAASLGAAAAAGRDRNLDSLFELLQKATTTAEAQSVEGAIWTLWMQSGDADADTLMQLGVAAMNAGDLDAALAAFDSLVKAAPDFAEAWNKRATVYYMAGDYAASVADIERTLALEPRHFGALSGLGLIYAHLGQEKAALRAFEAALKIDPHLPGARAYIEAVREKSIGRAI